MTEISTANLSGPASARGLLKANWAFLVAMALLALTSVGVFVEKWVEKEPIPWPAAVQVDEHYRMTSLPQEMGPFVALGFNDPNAAMKEEVLGTLGMGTLHDPQRLPLRRSNWYASQRYQDKRNQQVWQVEMYYYTGIDDKVPHVPERCLAAAGFEILQDEIQNVTWDLAPAQMPWPAKVEFRRVPYRAKNIGEDRRVSYYVFSLNGEPEIRWEAVRADLAKPWVKYCYFAKIQFSPMWLVNNLEATDEAARELARYALPHLLTLVPMPADLKALNATKDAPNANKTP